MKKVLLILFCFITTLAFAQSDWTFDELMSNRDKRKTGIKKLTPKQKQALQEWINTHFEVKDSSFSGHLPTVSEVMHSGKYVSLSDKSTWEIAPHDQSIVRSWLTPSKISVKKSKNSEYPYMLVNQDTKTSVEAKKVSPLSS